MASKVALNNVFICLNMVCSISAIAKIADCESITDGSVEYRSHVNYVEAYDKSAGVLWHTVLTYDGEVRPFDPNLEADVQENIACIVNMKGSTLIVSYGKAKPYLIDRKSGSVVGRIDFPRN